MKFSCFPGIMGCSSSKRSFNVTPVNSYRGTYQNNEHRTSYRQENENDITTKQNAPAGPSPEIFLTTNNNDPARKSQDSNLTPKTRRQGIHAARRSSEDRNSEDIKIIKVDKDPASGQLIRKAIQNNKFLSKIVDDDERMQLVVDVMYSKELEANSLIIKEGETGNHMYVSATGLFEVFKGENAILKKFGVGEAFGELAILYGAPRLASIKVLTPAKVWVLDRRVFKKINKRTILQEQESNIQFLRSVDLFQELHPTILAKVSDLLQRVFFEPGSIIVRQGDPGDKFYIIRAGTVTISKNVEGIEQSFGTLTEGHYFGELALQQKENVRQATITALDTGVECLSLDQEAFTKYLGDLEELNNQQKYNSVPVKRVTSEWAHIQLEDLNFIGTLGVGGFGRVELVQYKNENITFALKKLKKIDMVQQQQQDHAYNEKNIMINCNSRFICRLYQTYKDTKYLYFLMEACLGGDVWTILQKRKEFDEATAKFMSACVILAFEHLHDRNFIYRDLKPENLILDANGYVKLVDFGFAKKVEDGAKTWTFAGTPEYVAPEIILNRGHNRAVDYWALGIFIHELLAGRPPFRGRDHMKTYNLILKGIDNVIFSSKIPKVVQNLIKKLCRPASTERLGCFRDGIKDIKNHRWYMGFNWDALEAGTLAAPLVNEVSDSQDLQNFERQPRDDDDPPEETSGWDRDF